ncbi:hypothetical protein ThidrDRAFT_0454 [Thiorhodococcus drewsii AZ1]|uniref:ATPase n=1 Tax=Thiorhodococcus drewsii AZ1 TaxID=765913 RepID=G2DWR5_9GAMM|nr:V-type ATP synthase subunit F [Thiorhodococcus drewsii]EGV33765.1 hypothetical protein ThidrDRAFT_0454 [Thiorhodococcus drewsii AZ1]
MDTHQDLSHPTRMLFLGEGRLADGFRLIGFEVHPDPSPEEVDRIFRDLQRTRERTFVIVDDAIMGQNIPHLQQARREGGRILVIAVPALNAPPTLSSDVARRLAALFGAAALESSQTGEREPQ